ncbi:MAG: D-alanyl-D-alanine carboxypeptidase family protein, partial [Candidatus Spechtbacterales bacterium]|nr:D-alanyl-D-alanine carboxypeptidase family protein [Candidatus Spechtbacterales bacterium]
MSTSIKDFTQEEKDIILSFIDIIEKFKKEREGGVVTLAFEELKKETTPGQNTLIEKVLEVNPADYGINIDFLGIEPVPGNLVPIERQSYEWEGEKKQIATQYLPKQAYEAYMQMNKVLKKDTGSWLLVKSAYRSPAYQLLTFLYWLTKYNFNLKETLKHSTLPGYSEHGYPPGQAIDFMTKDGVI